MLKHKKLKENEVFVERGKNMVNVQVNGKTREINFNDIYYISSFGDYTHVHLNSEKVMAKKLLKEWERELPNNFIRVHRGTIINSDYLKDVKPHSKYTKKLFLKNNDDELYISARFLRKVSDKLGISE